jgi:c-di-GMP-binding flagellar brake protein YcgR
VVLGRFLRSLRPAAATRKFADLRFDYNHPVTVEVEGDDEQFGSIVYDFGEQEMIIFVPRGKKSGRPLTMKDGDVVSLTLPQRGGAYQGYARVVEVRNFPDELITMAVSEDWEERQDRRFYRLQVQLPVLYAPVSNRGLNPEDFVSSRTLDLSGGGAKFPVEGRYRRGELLYVQFDILVKGEVHSIILTGKVVRVEESLSLGTIVAVEFTDISEREQRLLVDWVGSQQA